MKFKEFEVIFNQHLEDFEKLKHRVLALEQQRVNFGVDATPEDLKKLTQAMHDWELSVFKRYSGSQ